MQPGKLLVVNHPLVQHKLALLRCENTGTKEFKELVAELATLLCYEATRSLPTEEAEVQTPLATAKVRMLAGRKLAFVPILRAGLGMLEGVERLVPAAKVGHIGLYRDPQTLNPVEYYTKLPGDIAERSVFLLDPMLATGGSAVDAVSTLKKRGAQNISFLGILASPIGIEKLQKEHPDVNIYLACVDEGLNQSGFILPGLGDAGDRIFGTK